MGKIHLASYKGSLSDIEAILEGNSDLVNEKDVDGFTPLHIALSENHLEVVKLLISKGADINARDNEDSTPLHIAARMSKKLAKILITNGANVNATDCNKTNPLEIALEKGKRDIAALLCRHGAKKIR